MTEFARMFFMLLLALACCALSLFCWLLWRELKALSLRLALQPAPEAAMARLEQLCRTLDQQLRSHCTAQQQRLTVLQEDLAQLDETLQALRARLEQPPAPTDWEPVPPAPPPLIPMPGPLVAGTDADTQRRQWILDLHHRGASEVEIARTMNTSRHEVQMIIGLHRQGRQPVLPTSEEA